MPRLISLLVFLLIVAAGVPVDAAEEAAPASQSPSASPVDVENLVILAFPVNDAPYVTTVGTFGQVIGLQPGNEVVLALGLWDDEVCPVGIRCFNPVAIPASWSVRPDAGARIDPEHGQLSIDPGTPGGSQFTVEAVVEGRDEAVTADVYVYTPESNPFVGYWRETAQLTCDNGTEVIGDALIEELVFAADGSFAITWMPFESYVDYWGNYTYNLADGTLDLTITGGNQEPDDADGSGHYTLDANGNLVLTDMWLGTSAFAESGTPNCGHRFAR